MTFLDDPRQPRLWQWTLTFVPFSALVSWALMGAIVQPEVIFTRAQWTALAALVLATPALAIYLRCVAAKPLPTVWRLLWTFAWLTYLLHFFYGFGGIFEWSFATVLARQGTVVGISNFVLTGLWSADVFTAWLTRNRTGLVAILRGTAHVLTTISFLASTILFRPGPPRLLGIGLLLVLVATTFFRILGPRHVTIPGAPLTEGVADNTTG